MAVIKDVIFNYVKIKRPAPKYGKDSECPINDREYTVDVCLPAETAKKLKKKYKTVKSVKNMPMLEAEDYKKTYKTDAPDPEVYANADGEYAVLKLTAFAGYQDGTPVPDDQAPRVVGNKTRTLSDNGKKVGKDIEVGNGSTGKVSFSERQWEWKDTKGLSLDLTGIQIEQLVEYFGGNKNVNEFEFEEDDDDFAYEEHTPSDSDKEAESEETGDGETPDDDEW